MTDWYDRQQDEHPGMLRGPGAPLGSSKPRPKKTRVLYDVFSLFRPWQGCFRCKADQEDGRVVLPESSDHVCPHIRRGEYEALLTRLRNPPTNGHGPTLLAHNTFNNERGETFGSVTWEEPEDVPVTAKEAPRKGVPTL